MEDKMRNTACLAAALAAGLLAAGCVQDAQYPSTAYASDYSGGYYPASSYSYPASYSTAYSPGYYNPGYTTYSAGYASYSPRYSGYVAPTSTRSQRSWNSARRDSDRDGVPNRYDRDANGDAIPDRYQGRAVRYR
jgi:hypothetical protein